MSTESQGPPADRAGPHAEQARLREIEERLRALGYTGETELVGEDGLLLADEDRMSPGYTLFAVQLRSMAKLVDEAGRVVKVWRDPEARQWENVRLLENGDLITTGNDPHEGAGIVDETRFAMRLDWDGEVVWKKYLRNHHDITVTPRGELLSISLERRLVPEVHPTAELADDQILRLTQEGELIEAVSIYDVVVQRPDLFPMRTRSPKMYGGSMWVDLLHTNSIEWMYREELFDVDPIYGPNNVLFCQRFQNRVAIIDYVDRELLWAWGEEELDGPHCASVLEGGNILIFDNGVRRGWSRVIEIDPLEGEIVWSYEHPEDVGKGREVEEKHLYTLSQGSAQRLPNGNTLLCNANKGEIIEVTRGGDLVWKYVSTERVRKGKGAEPKRAALVRAYRYERSFIERLMSEHGDE